MFFCFFFSPYAEKQKYSYLKSQNLKLERYLNLISQIYYLFF